MRNQIEAAERGGLRADTINSDNRDDWDRGHASCSTRDEVDVLLVCPERFANPAFRSDVLPLVAERVGLLVIDEVHCISDWGHDFRPDYRRLARVLDLLPAGVPGARHDRHRERPGRRRRRGAARRASPAPCRGPLDRESLALDVVELPGAGRAAGLARAGAARAARHRASSTRSPSRRGARRRVAAHAGHRGRGLHRRDRDRRSSRSRSELLRQRRSRPSSRPPRSAWATTSPTSRSSCTTSRPARRSPTTSRSAGPAARIERAEGILLRGHEDADIQDCFIRTRSRRASRSSRVLDCARRRRERQRAR